MVVWCGAKTGLRLRFLAWEEEVRVSCNVIQGMLMLLYLTFGFGGGLCFLRLPRQ